MICTRISATRWFLLFALSGAALQAEGTAAQPTRAPTESVNSRTVREKGGLRPGENLLFNGWGVTPAGQHVAISDLALKLIIAPDKRRLVAVHGGFNKHG